MKATVSLPALLLLPGLVGVGLVAGHEHMLDWGHDGHGHHSHHHHNATRVGCPADESVSRACWGAVTPPFPICEGKTTAEWVAKARDSSTRCCGDDASACRCPVKSGDKFLSRIGGYCEAVADDCGSGGNLRGGGPNSDADGRVQ